MGLSTKNRKWVVGALIVGTLGGGGLITKGIVFGGDASKTTLEQVPKIAPAAGGLVDTAGDLTAKGITNLSKAQTALDKLNANTTTTAATATTAGPGAAGNPDS